jgi:hypothetical protein
VPTTNECRFGERGDGGGGSFTGRVGIGAAVVVSRVVDGEVLVVAVGAVVVASLVTDAPACVDAVVGAAWLSLPFLEERIIAATTPPVAATATTPASTAFLTEAEATLARPWPILARSS